MACQKYRYEIYACVYKIKIKLSLPSIKLERSKKKINIISLNESNKRLTLRLYG